MGPAYESAHADPIRVDLMACRALHFEGVVEGRLFVVFGHELCYSAEEELVSDILNFLPVVLDVFSAFPTPCSLAVELQVLRDSPIQVGNKGQREHLPRI